MLGKKTFLAIIPARLSSKRLKKKNIKILNKKPLVYWTIKEAKKSKYIDKIFFSTESKKIRKIVESFNINVPFLRPKHLSKDNVSSERVCLDVLKKIKKKYDYIILLQPTSPLRKSKNIDDAIKLIYKKKYKSITSIYTSKLRKKNLIYLTKKNFLTKNSKNAQKNRKNFFMNGAIYIAKTDYFIKKKIFLTKKSAPYFMSEKVSYDIDNLNDFLKVKKALKN